jgi:hypothetical protein
MIAMNNSPHVSEPFQYSTLETNVLADFWYPPFARGVIKADLQDSYI